jgi:hypothetical protein
MRKEVLQNDIEKLNGINIISPIMLTLCRDSYAILSLGLSWALSYNPFPDMFV